MLYKFLEIKERTHKKVEAVLESLLVEPTLKLINYASMNDPNEMKFEFKIGSARYFKTDWLRRNPGKSVKDFEKWFAQIKSERPQSARTEFVLYRRNLFKLASLSTSHKSNLLWSHYAGGTHGLCIVFRRSILENFEGQLWLSGNVLYKKNPPTVRIPEKNATEELKKVCFTKEKCWEYEKEYRIAVINGAQGPIYLPIKKTDIFGVILGINASEKLRRSVAKICQASGYRLFEILDHRKGYSLPAVEIKNPNERLWKTKF